MAVNNSSTFLLLIFLSKTLAASPENWLPYNFSLSKVPSSLVYFCKNSSGLVVCNSLRNSGFLAIKSKLVLANKVPYLVLLSPCKDSKLVLKLVLRSKFLASVTPASKRF